MPSKSLAERLGLPSSMAEQGAEDKIKNLIAAKSENELKAFNDVLRSYLRDPHVRQKPVAEVMRKAQEMIGLRLEQLQNESQRRMQEVLEQQTENDKKTYFSNEEILETYTHWLGHFHTMAANDPNTPQIIKNYINRETTMYEAGPSIEATVRMHQVQMVQSQDNALVIAGKNDRATLNIAGIVNTNVPLTQNNQFGQKTLAKYVQVIMPERVSGPSLLTLKFMCFQPQPEDDPTKDTRVQIKLRRFVETLDALEGGKFLCMLRSHLMMKGRTPQAHFRITFSKKEMLDLAQACDTFLKLPPPLNEHEAYERLEMYEASADMATGLAEPDAAQSIDRMHTEAAREWMASLRAPETEKIHVSDEAAAVYGALQIGKTHHPWQRKEIFGPEIVRIAKEDLQNGSEKSRCIVQSLGCIQQNAERLRTYLTEPRTNIAEVDAVTEQLISVITPGEGKPELSDDEFFEVMNCIALETLKNLHQIPNPTEPNIAVNISALAEAIVSAVVRECRRDQAQLNPNRVPQLPGAHFYDLARGSLQSELLETIFQYVTDSSHIHYHLGGLVEKEELAMLQRCLANVQTGPVAPWPKTMPPNVKFGVGKDRNGVLFEPMKMENGAIFASVRLNGSKDCPGQMVITPDRKLRPPITPVTRRREDILEIGKDVSEKSGTLFHELSEQLDLVVPDLPQDGKTFIREGQNLYVLISPEELYESNPEISRILARQREIWDAIAHSRGNVQDAVDLRNELESLRQELESWRLQLAPLPNMAKVSPEDRGEILRNAGMESSNWNFFRIWTVKELQDSLLTPNSVPGDFAYLEAGPQPEGEEELMEETPEEPRGEREGNGEKNERVPRLKAVLHAILRTRTKAEFTWDNGEKLDPATTDFSKVEPGRYVTVTMKEINLRFFVSDDISKSILILHNVEEGADKFQGKVNTKNMVNKHGATTPTFNNFEQFRGSLETIIQTKKLNPDRIIYPVDTDGEYQTPLNALGRTLKYGPFQEGKDPVLPTDPADAEKALQLLKQEFDMVLGWKKKQDPQNLRMSDFRTESKKVEWIFGGTAMGQIFLQRMARELGMAGTKVWGEVTEEERRTRYAAVIQQMLRILKPLIYQDPITAQAAETETRAAEVLGEGILGGLTESDIPQE